MARKFLCWGRSPRISASWPYKVSGTESNQAFIDLLEVGYDKCTRLDIQFTTPYLLDIRLVNLLMILDLANKVNIKDLLSFTKTATVLIRSM